MMSIWEYKDKLRPEIKPEFQLSLGEGSTPLYEVPATKICVGVERILIKSEGDNPTGSFKDRCIAFQLSAHFQMGHKRFAISSSGNAAISAISYTRLIPSTLDVFVSDKITGSKLDRLLSASNVHLNDKMNSLPPLLKAKNNVTLHFSSKPRFELLDFIETTNAIDLRASQDDLAIEGYKTLAFELARKIRQCDAIFIPTSSGTSCIGLYRGYKMLGHKIPRLNIVQTTKIHPIAGDIDKGFTPSKVSLATAISDRVAVRKASVQAAIKDTDGCGWVISDIELKSAKAKYLHLGRKDSPSYDSLLSLAGLIKACSKGLKFKTSVLIFSG